MKHFSVIAELSKTAGLAIEMSLKAGGGPLQCCTNGRIGPTWDNPKLRHFYRSLSQSADLSANKNDVI